MRYLVAATFLALAAATSSVPAAAKGLVQSVFEYECEKANEDKLPFKCALKVEETGPYLTFTLTGPGNDYALYRRNLLLLRFYEGGGKHFTVVDMVNKRRQRCGRPVNSRHGVVCQDSEPIN